MPSRSQAGPRLLAGGDIAINRSEAKGAFGRLIPLLREADVSFANLELPLSHDGKPAPEKILLRGAPEMAGALTEAGFDVMAFANNHVLDYGEDAFAETMSLMDSLGVALVGGGMNLAQARKPVLIERGNLTIGFLAYCSVIPRGFEAMAGDPGVNSIRAHTAYRPWRDLSEYPGTPPRIDTWAEPAHLARMKRDIRNLKEKSRLCSCKPPLGHEHDARGDGHSSAKSPTRASTRAPISSWAATRTFSRPSNSTRARPSSTAWGT